ncbi:MAG TPA: HyaD/HybD family hydrogenase maturation endopeptidase [Caldimonas sp.]|nr:HyaD/HybD family hydrogenase maturation endopeptidase [Caldimonas sp.]
MSEASAAAQAGIAVAPLPSVLVLGIGNMLWADEGFGVRALEALHQRYRMPEQVSLVDGGTQGMYLLDRVCAADYVLVLDAIDYGLRPGTLRLFRDDAVPAWSDTMMSLHQATFQELLTMARLRDRFPSRITLIGVQPQRLDDLGGSLSPCVRDRVDEAVELAAAELRAWGVRPVLRDTPPQDSVVAAPLSIAAYESGRPSANDACRIGDERVLAAFTPRERD